MFQNYIKIVWRNMTRQPLHSLLNLSCLTFGIAAAILILMYLDFELHFDKFHTKGNHIYRVETLAVETHDKVIDLVTPRAPAVVGPLLKEEFPEVVAYNRVYNFFLNDVVQLNNDGKEIESNHISVADAGILDIFTFDFIYGDKNKALDGPNEIILSQTLAQKIFGDSDPLGKILKSSLVHSRPDVDPNYTFVVAGVYKDFPDNSTLNLEGIISAQSDPKLAEYYFRTFSFYTYVLLHESADPKAFEKKIGQIYEKHLDAERVPMMKLAHHQLVPLYDIHLNETGGPSYLYIFAVVGFLLLLIAMISYVNIVTAQASKRALEIGVRKVMGSSRAQLIVQFLSESLFFSILALLSALLVVTLAMEPLNHLLNLQLNTAQLWQPQLIFGALGIIILLGLVGGAYPAFFLSSFQPVTILKGKTSRGAPLRRALVAVQFAVVIFVLISTGMIYDQLQFMRNKDLGFNKDQTLHMSFPSEAEIEKSDVFKQALKQSPLISAVGTSSFTPGIQMFRRPISVDSDGEQESKFVHFGSIDYDYLEAMDIQLVEGRNFSRDHQEDEENHLIVNETFVKAYGLKNPIGERVRYGDKNNPDFHKIIGVINDFHQGALHDPIATQMLTLDPASFSIAIKIDKNIPEGIEAVKNIWATTFPNVPFAYRFLDEDLQRAYEQDEIRGKIFLMLSFLTLFIAFLGLFGLVAFIARQRVKEIGIRRVLGAKVWDVVYLLSKDFLMLVTIAAIPAFAIAWYFINQWLEDFAYRTEMNYVIFGLVLIFTLLLTLATTSLHAIRTTLKNPAETLKYE